VAPAKADEASAMAALPKAEFLEQFAVNFETSMLLNEELLRRLDPDLAGAVDTNPITDAEMATVDCTYDKMADNGNLEDFARQTLGYRIAQERADADPEFDFVDSILNPEMLDMWAGLMPDDLMDAMLECKSMEAFQSRLDMSPELWAVVSEAAEARGYN
jgi:hypothetical protein